MTDTPHHLVINLAHSTPPDQREQRVPFTAEDHAQRERDSLEGERTAWVMLRAERNAHLTTSDWSQLGDTPLTTAQRTAWKAYRQALRDLPAGLNSPHDPPWPEPPTKAAT